MREKSKRLRILAGPNGSGKSTVVKKLLSTYYCGPYVNADNIQQLLEQKHVLNLSAEYGLDLTKESFDLYLKGDGASWMEKASKENSPVHLSFLNNNLVVPANTGTGPYDAAIAADFIRYQLLANQQTFTFETVLSHASKLSFMEKAKGMGYKNYLYFICTVDPAINVNRVAQRVTLKGHHVPEGKIRSRYYDSLKLLPSLIPLTHRTFLFDNSSEDSAIDLIAEIVDGTTLNPKTEKIPWWVNEYVIEPLF